jgi:hypothetical protein
MRQADVIALTVGALFVIWLVRTGRAKRITAGTGADPIMQAFEATGSTGAFPVAPSPFTSQKGKAIAERAKHFLGAPTSQFNAQYPRRACSSFTSEILVQLGLMDREHPRCVDLMASLSGKGATKVGSGPAGTTPTREGDIIFFRDKNGVVRHVEIAGGGGASIGTSSSQQKVGQRPIGSRGYPLIDVWRY